MSARLDISAATHIGRVRKNNQDCVLVGQWTGSGPDETHETTYQFDLPLFPCVIADGMGGHNAGEVASALAIDILKREIGEGAGSIDTQRAVEAAARGLHAQSRDRPELSRMGTTVVGALFHRDRSVTVFNVGDSRAYVVRGDELAQVSVDDVQTARGDRRSGHVLTQAIGGSDLQLLPRAHETRLPPMPVGATIMLCSDGLYDMVPEREIHEAIVGSTANSATNLVRRAVEYGGRDNVSVIVARLT